MLGRAKREHPPYLASTQWFGLHPHRFVAYAFKSQLHFPTRLDPLETIGWLLPS